MQDIIGSHGRHCTNVLDVGFSAVLHQKINNNLLPVGSVAEQAQVTEWYFRTACFPLTPGQLVGEGNQNLAEPLSLVLR